MLLNKLPSTNVITAIHLVHGRYHFATVLEVSTTMSTSGGRTSAKVKEYFVDDLCILDYEA